MNIIVVFSIEAWSCRKRTLLRSAVSVELQLLLYIQEEARNTITKMLDELQFGRTEPIVRVNSVDSGLAQDDIKTVMQANSLPPTWMIPKVDDPLDIQWVSCASCERFTA